MKTDTASFTKIRHPQRSGNEAQQQRQDRRNDQRQRDASREFARGHKRAQVNP